MEHLLGPMINSLGIVAGAVIGVGWGSRLADSFRRQALRLVGVVVLVIGLKMALMLTDPVNTLLALMIGAWLGSVLKLTDRLDAFGRWMESRVGRGQFMQGFIAASLIFNVGAMAIVGSIQAGLTSHPTILETKAILDGVTALLLASTAGWGVFVAAPMTLVYEGLLTVLAHLLHGFLVGALLSDLSVVGGVMIAAIGINFLMDRTLIRIADLLPALIITVILGWLKRQGLALV